MAYWKKNESIERIEHDTESEIIEMRRQLDLATEEAKQELAAARENLRSAAEDCRQEIDSLSDEAKEGFEDIQSRLGRLNYLLAEEEIENVEKLDRHGQAILEEMGTARQQIAAVENESKGHLQSSYGKVETAWKCFLQSLELIRVRLKEAENRTDARFAEERETLRKRLAEHGDADDSDSLAAELWEGIKEHKRWIIAFFQSPLEATPTPPPPGYASTTDKSSNHGTGG